MRARLLLGLLTTTGLLLVGPPAVAQSSPGGWEFTIAPYRVGAAGGYRASDLVSVYLGYRALDMDYESGNGNDRSRMAC